MRFKRNSDRMSSVAEIQHRILAELLKFNATIFGEQSLRLSQLGYAGYEGYIFGSPQAAALAVSRIVKAMLADGLIFSESGNYRLSSKGLIAAKQL